jgi:hypothetical protein
LVKPSLLPVFAVGLGLAALPALAQDSLVIDHKAIGCIVAEQYPQMNACLSPAPAVAQTRVYFRASGTPHFYFVSGTNVLTCYGYVLPKPKKTIKKIDYYVEGTSKEYAQIKAFTPSRTAEYNPDVVESASECKKDVPVAPFLSKASVVVGVPAGAPAIIPGFTGFVGAAAGGLSGGAITGIVLGGAAIAGTVVVASNNNDTTNTTTAITQPPTTVSPVPTTTTTPTTTTPQGFAAVFEVLPDPPSGTEPLEVTFSECKSTGVDLKYFYDFDGDGVDDLKGGCSVTKIYSIAGITSTAATTLPPQSRFFDPIVCVGQGTLRQCHPWHIVVNEAGGLSARPAVAATTRRVAWTSELDLDGGSGQVVVNGEAAAFASRGRSAGAAVGRRGLNRIEAQVVEATGQPGMWRFELGTTGSLEAGSIRVIAGEVALVTENAVMFRLKGRPGERIVFSFRTGR